MPRLQRADPESSEKDSTGGGTNNTARQNSSNTEMLNQANIVARA
jgi:hypothetical protein